MGVMDWRAQPLSGVAGKIEFEPRVETRGVEALFNLGLEDATPLALGATSVLLHHPGQSKDQDPSVKLSSCRVEEPGRQNRTKNAVGQRGLER